MMNDRLTLRMPDGMREALKREGSLNQRSLNAEIIYALKNYLGDKQKEPLAATNLANGSEDQPLRKGQPL